MTVDGTMHEVYRKTFKEEHVKLAIDVGGSGIWKSSCIEAQLPLWQTAQKRQSSQLSVNTSVPTIEGIISIIEPVLCLSLEFF